MPLKSLAPARNGVVILPHAPLPASTSSYARLAMVGCPARGDLRLGPPGYRDEPLVLAHAWSFLRHPHKGSRPPDLDRAFGSIRGDGLGRLCDTRGGRSDGRAGGGDGCHVVMVGLPRAPGGCGPQGAVANRRTWDFIPAMEPPCCHAPMDRGVRPEGGATPPDRGRPLCLPRWRAPRSRRPARCGGCSPATGW